VKKLEREALNKSILYRSKRRRQIFIGWKSSWQARYRCTCKTQRQHTHH